MQPTVVEPDEPDEPEPDEPQTFEDVAPDDLDDVSNIDDSSNSDSSDAPDRNEVEVSEAVIDESDMAGGLFSGEETAKGTTEQPDPDSDDAPSEADFAESANADAEQIGLDGPSSDTIADAINDGAARLGVVGLDDAERGQLEGELKEVFEAFRLGYFGARAAEEHLFSGQEDVDPVWGLLGASLVCGAVTLYMRPDGDEQIANIKRGLGLDDDEDDE